MASKLVLAFLLCCLIATSAAAQSQRGESRQLEYQLEAQQCNMDRISSSQPTFRMQHEGGVTQLWDPQEQQFICAGIAPFRDVIEPQSLSVPKFFPAPRLVYIEQGTGVLGINFPGCPATFHGGRQQQQGQYQRGPRRMMGSGRGDEHQKIHRIQQGDIVAIPPGAATWSYNDGNQNLVYVTIVDLNNDHNQLDQNLRGFLLGGGRSEAEESRRPEGRGYQGGRSRRGWKGVQAQEQLMSPNVFHGFDEELIAEALNVQTETVRRMQNDNRGMIVRCQEEMRFTTEEDEQMQEMGWGRQSQRGRGGKYLNEENEKSLPAAEQEQENGIEESYCNMKIKHNLERPVQADFFSRDAGRINIANRHKLPILGYLDMSAERGSIMPNAMYTPHWSMTDHRAVYVLRGDLQVQISDDNGNQIMNNRVQEGEMFVIPQFFATMGIAGNQGCEYVTFKTSGRAMKHQIAGSTSVMRAMPIDVLSNAFQMSPREAEQLKLNRDPESMLLSPTTRARGSYPTPSA